MIVKNYLESLLDFSNRDQLLESIEVFAVENGYTIPDSEEIIEEFEKIIQWVDIMVDYVDFEETYDEYEAVEKFLKDLL